MPRLLTALAALLLAAATAGAQGSGGGDRPRPWRPQRQVRSLESGDELGARLFSARHRRLARRRARGPAPAPPPEGVDVGEWLSRFGEVEARPRER